ncbi:ornithine decarboxylase antizyme [Podospora fimiseda]|uniref:Ornithine decarboxylase antizyme n=1 Tax=Podospora fimiseda TaxID=252190 RepID=A0AAN7BEY6_9PEZI|nr:ornithine decarboxylase antizyme [Podospora fimiseda]
MAPMKQTNNNWSSSNYGEGIVHQANILASCYLLALTPKARKSRAGHGVTAAGSSTDDNQRRRGGAALRIRGECERFLCETLRAMFLGERNGASQHSTLTSVYYNQHHNINVNNTNNNNHYGQLTPPDDFPIAQMASAAAANRGNGGFGSDFIGGPIQAYLEIWDYVGGSSFRAFVAEDAAAGPDENKSLFVFFDRHGMSRDLKQALVALIELAEGPLECSHMVICIERTIPAEEAKALTRGLQWAGFSLTTLDYWSGGLDVVSDRWLFMGMEV